MTTTLIIIWNIILDYAKRYWKIALIILLVVALWFRNSQYNEQKDKANRLEDNAESTTLRPTRQLQVLTAKEFDKLFSARLDSFEQRLDKKIKTKDVYNITHLHEYYIDSSKTVYNSKVLADGVFDISNIGECLGFRGQFDLRDTTTTIDSAWFENDINTIVFDDRKRWFGAKKLLPKWGMPKNVILESYNRCNSQTTIERTVIKKRKK